MTWFVSVAVLPELFKTPTLCFAPRFVLIMLSKPTENRASSWLLQSYGFAPFAKPLGHCALLRAVMPSRMYSAAIDNPNDHALIDVVVSQGFDQLANRSTRPDSIGISRRIRELTALIEQMHELMEECLNVICAISSRVELLVAQLDLPS